MTDAELHELERYLRIQADKLSYAQLVRQRTLTRKLIKRLQLAEAAAEMENRRNLKRNDGKARKGKTE